VIDVDAEPDPPADWFKAELDACRRRIAELEAENEELRDEVDFYRNHPDPPAPF
jgi:hypothetical protein